MTMTTISKPASAVQLLRGYRVPRTVHEALLYLYSLSEPLEVIRLYRHYFPAEFARSTASVRVPTELRHTAYAPIEVEFLGLVNERMFPISDWLLDLGRSQWVPVQTQNLEWWDSDLDSWRVGWQFLLVMSGIMYDDAYGRGDLTDESWKMLKALQPYPQVGPWREMQDLCPKMPAPLCDLVIAMSVIDHSTGNALFDTDTETPFQMTWSVEDFDTLAAWWAEAQPMWNKAEALIDWLEASEENRAKCIAFWRVCLEKPVAWDQALEMVPYLGELGYFGKETQSDASNRDLAGGDVGSGDGGETIRARRTPISTLHREIGIRRRRRRRTFIARADALIRRVSGGAR